MLTERKEGKKEYEKWGIKGFHSTEGFGEELPKKRKSLLRKDSLGASCCYGVKLPVFLPSPVVAR